MLSHLALREIDEAPCCPLMLDMADAGIPTAAGLGELVTLPKRVRASGGQLVLCHVGQAAYEVFQLTGLPDVLDVRRDEAAAK